MDEVKKMDSQSVKEFIRKEVPDWNDELIATARFKAFSGQRSDWEPKFQFWKDLIIKISRYFGLFIISPSQVLILFLFLFLFLFSTSRIYYFYFTNYFVYL